MSVVNYFATGDAPFEHLGSGIKRRVNAHSANLMCVEVHFETRAEGSRHSHRHEQIIYVISGRFEFDIDGEEKMLKAGDAAYIQPNVVHGSRCLDGGVLLDVFTPCRVDFL